MTTQETTTVLEKRQCWDCGALFYLESDLPGHHTKEFYYCPNCGCKNSEYCGKVEFKD